MPMLKKLFAALQPYLQNLPPWGVAAAVTVTLLVGFVMKKQDRNHIPATCFTVFYLCLVYTSTVLSRIPRGEVGIVLKPFWSYAQWIQGNDLFLKYIVLNILMLLPVGISLCYIWQNRKKIVAFGFAFSCLIETSQLLTSRGLFEVDDIIHNTAGTALGILICTVVEGKKIF